LQEQEQEQDPQVANITLIGRTDDSLLRELGREMAETNVISPEEFSSAQDADPPEASYVYLPGVTDRDGTMPDLAEAEKVFRLAAESGAKQFVLLSSALIYGTGPGRQALVTEDYSAPGYHDKSICHQWASLESLAGSKFAGRIALTILRPSAISGSSAFPVRSFSLKFVPTLPGHDPVLQLLSVTDLACAIRHAIERQKAGIFNVAPDAAIPLHKAVCLAGKTRVAFPRTLQRVVHRSETLDYLRYPWTISNAKIKRELGFVPKHSSLAALRKDSGSTAEPEFDEFGMDKDYIRFYGKTLFKFLSEFYWRIEHNGIEHIPAHGRGILVGMHRGFMPFDGVMALHNLVRKTGRYPRFLTHPALLKFPFLANFMTKLGGIVACQESAGRVLESNELVGIFPEGIQGAFTLYQNAYKLQAFGRDAFVKLALRYQAPIIPFVTVGSAEIFPIFGKIKMRRLSHFLGWPYIPVTPTFPVLPVPLPSKWHTQFLAPISTEEYPPEAAHDRAVVKAISREVRTRMQHAVDDMLAHRRSIFFGSVFEQKHDESQSKPVPI
jgi:1-acyl-sn-glycerol-3-phosphate acyltransferase